jgi:stage III sporulation protein AE
MRKYLGILIVSAALLFIFYMPACAEEIRSEITESDVPKEVLPYLPDGIFETDIEHFRTAFSVSNVMKTVLSIIADVFPQAAAAFSVLLGLTVISAVMAALRESVASKNFGEFLNYVSAVCVCAAAFTFIQELFAEFEIFISRTTGFMAVVIPTMAALMLTGGEPSSSMVFGGVLSAVVTALELICTSAVMPLLSALLCVYTVARISGYVDISAFAKLLKNIATYTLTGMILIMTCVLTFQSVIAKSADTAAVKGVKFVLGNAVPIVGGALADAVGTVASSLGMVKSATGIASAVVLCVICASPVLKLLVWKLVFDAISAIASAFSLNKEGEFFSNMGQITAFLAAIMASIGVFFIIALTAASLGGR